MSRLIDADALKRKVQKEATESWKMKIKASVETILNQVIDWINEAQTVEPEQQWIPVTENTLPKEDEWVIGVVDDIHDGSDAPGMAIVKLKKGISKTERDELRRQSDSRSLSFRECDEWGNNLVPYCWKTQGLMTYFGQQIIKWMPSPEP